jgi:hypothetical protein
MLASRRVVFLVPLNCKDCGERKLPVDLEFLVNAIIPASFVSSVYAAQRFGIPDTLLLAA